MNGGIQPGTYVGSSMYDGVWLAEFAGRVAKANVTECELFFFAQHAPH